MIVHKKDRMKKERKEKKMKQRRMKNLLKKYRNLEWKKKVKTRQKQKATNK